MISQHKAVLLQEYEIFGNLSGCMNILGITILSLFDVGSWVAQEVVTQAFGVASVSWPVFVPLVETVFPPPWWKVYASVLPYCLIQRDFACFALFYVRRDLPDSVLDIQS